MNVLRIGGVSVGNASEFDLLSSRDIVANLKGVPEDREALEYLLERQLAWRDGARASGDHDEHAGHAVAVEALRLMLESLPQK